VVEVDGQNYTIDALEMQSKHLWRNDLVQQAINITEAALLVYDVTSRESLLLTQGLHDLIMETVGNRDYALTLVGNKSDADDEERQVPWSEGSKTALTFPLKTSFIEVSAKTGDSISLLFPQVGKDIQKMKFISQQKREHAERMLRLKQEAKLAPKRKVNLWKRISRPFYRREVAQV
jgi:GTPase SAR1 family protein